MISSFLQSPEWEEFQRSLGRKTWRVNGALIVQHPLRIGLNYLYCPRPETKIRNQESRIRILDEISDIAATERSVFLKIDPAYDFYAGDTRYAIRDTRSLQPQRTIILDLEKSEEELLRAMHEKTRYNIRLAERKGVTVNLQVPSCLLRRSSRFGCEGRAKFQVPFWRLLQETASRDGFRTHPREYYEKMVGIRSTSFSNELFYSEYRGKILSAALVNFFRPAAGVPVATYLHGASDRADRAMMAPHLLHWRIMQEAKRRGFQYYDLWGIDEKRWPGLTRFKQGFGGQAITYPPSFDIVYRRGWYAAYSLWKRFLPR